MFIVFKGYFSYIIYKYFLIWDKEEVYEFYNYMRWEYVINIWIVINYLDLGS